MKVCNKKKGALWKRALLDDRKGQWVMKYDRVISAPVTTTIVATVGPSNTFIFGNPFGEMIFSGTCVLRTT